MRSRFLTAALAGGVGISIGALAGWALADEAGFFGPALWGFGLTFATIGFVARGAWRAALVDGASGLWSLA